MIRADFSIGPRENQKRSYALKIANQSFLRKQESRGRKSAKSHMRLPIVFIGFLLSQE